TRYLFSLKFIGVFLEFMYKIVEVIINAQALLLLDNVLYHFDQPLEGKKLAPFLNKRYISVPRATERKYYETFIIPLIEKYSVYAEGFDIKTIKEDAVPILTLNYIQNGESHIQLSFQYGDFTFLPTSDHKISVKMSYKEEADNYTFTRVKRSILWEENQHAYLESSGLKRQDALF